MLREEKSGANSISSDSICSQDKKIDTFKIMQFNVAFPCVSNFPPGRDFSTYASVNMSHCRPCS
jgi:hypothetical protein